MEGMGQTVIKSQVDYAAPDNSTLVWIMLALASFGAWRIWKAHRDATSGQ